MQSRMKHPVMVLPAALDALLALNKAITQSGIPEKTLELVHLRASQINGCSICLEMHAKQMRKLDETDERQMTVAGWRDSAYFSDPERAAFALTESVTRLSDRGDAVPDEVWEEAARHYNERELSGLLLAIAAINVWNRLNVSTRQIAGSVTAAA